MKRQAMKQNVSLVGFVVVTVFLVLFAAYFCVGTVKCMSDEDSAQLEMFYQEKEDALVEEIKTFLNQEGLKNSGVMLTRVVETDGSRQYILKVHHGLIDDMSENERADLMEDLEKIVFVDERCSFFHEFLINQ